MLPPVRKRIIGEELAYSPERYRQCQVGETSWVTVLPPKLIFIRELISILESRTCSDAQARVRESIVYVTAVCH